MISKHPIEQDNDHRLARWILAGGRNQDAPQLHPKTRARALRYARAKMLEEVARLTDELQAMGEE